MISLFPVLNDNYAFLLHEPVSNLTAAIDAPDGVEIAKQCEKNGWKLSHIFNTHHHYDHVGGNEYLKQKYNPIIIGPKAEAKRIPLIDQELQDGAQFSFGEYNIQFFSTPGHTLGHGVYYVIDENSVFVGDSLFVMGCGRLFEGTPEQMFESLQKLAKLPKDTKIYPAHEYSLANAKFALSVDPDNIDLQQAYMRAKSLTANNKPTIPSTIEMELKTNPFMRAQSAVQFAKLRQAKDNF